MSKPNALTQSILRTATILCLVSATSAWANQGSSSPSFHQTPASHTLPEDTQDTQLEEAPSFEEPVLPKDPIARLRLRRVQNAQTTLLDLSPEQRQDWNALITGIPQGTALGFHGELLKRLHQNVEKRDELSLIQQKNYEAAQAGVKAARGGYLPKVDATLGFSKNKTTCDLINTSCPRNSNTKGQKAEIALSQVIYSQALIEQNRLMKRSASLAKFAYQNTKENLITTLLNYLLTISITDRQIEAMRAVLSSLRRQEKVVKIRIAGGSATMVDSYNIQSRIHRSTYQLEQLTIGLQTALDELERITGVRLIRGLLPQIRAWDRGLYQLIDFDKPWLEEVYQHSPALAALRAKAQVARQNYELAKAGHYPTLSARLSHSRNKGTLSSGGVDVDKRNKETVLGIQLSIPIYQGGSVSNEADSRLKQWEAAKLEEAKTRSDLRIKVQAALASIRSGVYQNNALFQAEHATAASYRSALARYEVGKGTLKSLLDAEAAYLDSERQLDEALKRWVLDQVSLAVSAGQWSDDFYRKLGNLFGPIPGVES